MRTRTIIPILRRRDGGEGEELLEGEDGVMMKGSRETDQGMACKQIDRDDEVNS